MEIVTYVMEGELSHQDSLGNGAKILPGDVQRMSAGKGILHSEVNESAHERTHLLQIWIEPQERGLRPGYEQKHFAAADKRGRLRLVASPDGREGSVTIHADATLRVGLFDGAEQAALALDPERKVYVHLARGEAVVNGQALREGDALKLEGEMALHIGQGKAAEVLVFDLAA
jgi:redox-sensitive bicupin YhaK (pirin superfamily)